MQRQRPPGCTDCVTARVDATASIPWSECGQRNSALATESNRIVHKTLASSVATDGGARRRKAVIRRHQGTTNRRRPVVRTLLFAALSAYSQTAPQMSPGAEAKNAVA
ncbi:hypothetical protein HPB50_023212 [Hyalomma asiaticum]|uniref:Uncharacterized protein n=1 Tax=Hyalomma asiaticum TaxID=266040 RepID=A0ACB7SPB6_HYAAI|nr:hypothetical protein HPB50_023212 [Hyalomma asiaticum]